MLSPDLSLIYTPDPPLSPGDRQSCLGNGEHTDEAGAPIECCCDACDYALDCFKDLLTEQWYQENGRKGT